MSDLANGGEFVRALFFRKLPVEFILDGLLLLMLVKVLFTEGVEGCYLVLLHLNYEDGTASPAAVRPLIA